MDRREVLALLARVGGAGALLALAPDELLALGERVHAALPADGAPPAAVLTAAQRAAAVAAMETIIPRTDTPGATDARAVDFLEVLLAGWFDTAERDALVRGLDALDARAREVHGRAFARLAPAAQLAMLEALDAEAQQAPRARGAGGGPADATATHWFAGLKWVTAFAWGTSRPAMERALGSWPLPGRYDPDAPVRVRRAAPRVSGTTHGHGEVSR